MYKKEKRMKKNILLAVVLLLTGLQMAAKDRDLIGMRNFRELSNIPYDSLTPKEKGDVLYMAFRSGLPAQRSAARNLLNKKFKINGQEWTKLENMATNEGLNEVNTYFAAKLTGGSRAPSPVGVPLTPVAPPVPQPVVAQQPITVVPQDVKDLIDELAKLALQYKNEVVDKDDMTREFLEPVNESITKGTMTRDIAINGLKSFIQKMINDRKTELAETQNRITEDKKELANLGVDNAEIDKIEKDAFSRPNTGGYNGAAHDLHEKLQEVQLQQQNPLLNIPANLFF